MHWLEGINERRFEGFNNFFIHDRCRRLASIIEHFTILPSFLCSHAVLREWCWVMVWLLSAEGEEDEVVWGVVVIVRGVAVVLWVVLRWCCKGCWRGCDGDGTGVDGWHRCCDFEREGWHRLRNRCLVFKGARHWLRHRCRWCLFFFFYLFLDLFF